MLTGSYQKMNPYGDVKTPTAGTEFLTAAKVAAQEPFLLIPGVEESFPSIRKNVDLLEYYQSNPDRGLGRRAGDFLASVAGSSINPISLGASAVLGPAAGFAVKGVASLTGKFAPALLSKAVTPLAELLPNTPSFVGSQTAGGIAANTVKNYSKLFGFMLPEEIAATKDRNNYQFDWLGGIEAAAVDGGLTLALTPLAYFIGHGWGKIKKARSEVREDIPTPEDTPEQKRDTSQVIKNAVNDGHIDPKTGQWMEDYINGNDTHENLSSRAIDILYKDGHPVNQATQKVIFNVLRKEDVENLNHAFLDKLASPLSKDIKSDLSDYFIHNRIDSIKNGKDMTDGIDGVISYINKKLSGHEEQKGMFKDLLKKIDFIGENKSVRNFDHESHRSSLIKEEKLVDDFKEKPEYHNVVSMYGKNNEASRLFHELHYLDEVKNQEDLAHVLNMINSVVKSTDGHLADSQTMMQYMRNRASHAEGMQPKIDEVKVPEKLSGEAAPSIEDFDKQMESAPAEVKQEYELLKSKLKEVTGKQNVLKNLVSCVLGSRNGRV